MDENLGTLARAPDDDDLTIPRAAMNKMIKEILPNIRVANEAREMVLNCCTEFIHLISSESNEVCNAQQKKTISAEHVLAALDKLGFGDFKKEAEDVLHECKETAAKRRRQSTRLENLGIPEEELLRQQQELFAKAREAAVRQEQRQLLTAGAEINSAMVAGVPTPPAPTAQHNNNIGGGTHDDLNDSSRQQNNDTYAGAEEHESRQQQQHTEEDEDYS